MRLFIDPMAPNVRRARMFVAEKGIELPTVTISVDAGENRTDAFLRMNPLGQVPLLEVDADTFIAESVSICRYLEETTPRPCLFGASAVQRATVDMWNRRAEFRLFVPALEYGHHSHPMFRDRQAQIPEWARHNVETLQAAFVLLDERLATSSHVAGDEFSIADVTAYCGIELARAWGIDAPSELDRLRQWYERIYARPSARIARYG